ncbi:hypothetical protein ES705_23130 [subsurface metagenome]
MSKSSVIYRCETCDRTFGQHEAHFYPNGDIALCPVCQRILRLDAALSDNPIPPDFGLRLLGVLARILLNPNVVKTLDEKAADPTIPMDDAAVPVASVILQELAKL